MIKYESVVKPKYMHKKINIGLIWADPLKENLGVAALAYSSLFLFEKVAEESGIEFSYTIIGSSHERRNYIEIGERQINFQKIFWSYNGGFKSMVKVLAIHSYQFLRLLKLDIVFDMGAGDSFSDIYGINTFRKLNDSRAVIQWLGKRVAFLPQTIGPFYSKEAENQARKSIEKSDLVLVRDNQSYIYTKQLVPAKKIYEAVDVAFFLPYEKKGVIGDDAKVRVGINISGLLWNGGYTQDNQFGLKFDYKELVHKIILKFICNAGCEIYFVPHVVMKEEDNVDNDWKVSKELTVKYPGTKMSPKFTNPVEAKSFISEMDFFIGARMHACIAAFSTGVPVYPLAYSRKFNGLFGDTLDYEFFGDMVSSDMEVVLNDLECAFNNRHHLRCEIEAARARLKNKEIELINLISDAVKNEQQV